MLAMRHQALTMHAGPLPRKLAVLQFSPAVTH